MLAGAWFQPLLNTSYTLPEDSVCVFITLPPPQKSHVAGPKKTVYGSCHHCDPGPSLEPRSTALGLASKKQEGHT